MTKKSLADKIDYFDFISKGFTNPKIAVTSFTVTF